MLACRNQADKAVRPRRPFSARSGHRHHHRLGPPYGRREVFANRREVAEAFEKRHDNVLRDIDDLIVAAGSSELRSLFIENHVFSTRPARKSATSQWSGTASCSSPLASPAPRRSASSSLISASSTAWRPTCGTGATFQPMARCSLRHPNERLSSVSTVIATRPLAQSHRTRRAAGWCLGVVWHACGT